MIDSDKISQFEKIDAQLHGLFDEMNKQSVKRPNDALNKFKLKYVNDIIIKINNFLDKKLIPFQEFKKFEEDDLPTYSDVCLILSQYIECMDKMRSENITRFGDLWYWVIKEQRSTHQTSPPRKIMER